MYVYSFGAPGHGKGFFDGLGGALKNKIHSLIQGKKSGGDNISGTSSGYISNVEDVHDALNEYFENGSDGLRKNKSKNQVNKFMFFKHLTRYNTIRRTVETFTGLEKINSCYQFVVSNVGVVHSRKRSCWCMKCITSMCNGSLNWGTDPRVSGCVSSALQTTSIYDFQNRQCTKLTGPGVSLQLSERRESQNKMASQLTPGAWVLFKGRGHTDQFIWMGRTISKLGWNNYCVLKNVSSVTKSIEGAVVSRNNYTINVQWYTQKVFGVLNMLCTPAHQWFRATVL